MTSSYPKPVIVSEWEGMPATISPGLGIVYPSREIDGGTSYPRQDRVPRKVVVVWHVQTDPKVYWRNDKAMETFRQEIKLVDVIPKGKKGRTVFNLDKNGQWSVRFVRDSGVR